MRYTVPDSPLELGFQESEFPLFRPHQRDAIDEIINTDKSVVIMAAPTGSGKSLIALSAARILARETGGKSTILTHQKSLQDQYLAYKFDSLVPVVAKGRANFPCVLEGYESLMADEALCTKGDFDCPLMKRSGSEASAQSIPCPYYRQRDVAEESLIRILNYPYFFLQAPFQKRFRNNGLILCDEGHRVSKEILAAAGTKISASDLKLFEKRGTPFPRWEGRLLKENWHVVNWARAVKRDVDYERSQLADTSLNADKLADLLRLSRSLGRVLDLADKMVVLVNERGGGIAFSPVLSEENADRFLLQFGKKTVLMSATIFGAEYWAGRLGVDPSQVCYLEIPSIFPVERRRVLYLPVAHLNNRVYGNEEQMGAMLRAVDWAIQRHLPEKGLIHTTNWELAKFLQTKSRFRNLMVVSSGGTRLAEFDEKPVGVYVSPSAIEGYDFKDDLARFIIFPKVPYLNMGDPVVDAQRSLIPGFYEYEAQSAVIQGAGRGMRHEEDRCITYIFDDNYARLYGQTKQMLPNWFKEALVWYSKGVAKQTIGG